ncbi:MAG: type II toxin-antitoxin system HicA family toxin [Dehalococcoidia bacterium]|nr:type II toxin-antitoxin system HicA family toxin [Dehalococcoidia bacterium]
METNRERIVRRLLREGWVLVRHGGNHDIYKNERTGALVPIPRHRNLTPGLARRIIRLNGWTEWL